MPLFNMNVFCQSEKVFESIFSIEGYLMPGHIRILVSIPLKISASLFVRYSAVIKRDYYFSQTAIFFCSHPRHHKKAKTISDFGPLPAVCYWFLAFLSIFLSYFFTACSPASFTCSFTYFRVSSEQHSFHIFKHWGTIKVYFPLVFLYLISIVTCSPLISAE